MPEVFIFLGLRDTSANGEASLTRASGCGIGPVNGLIAGW